jgi:hypothetical protein
MKDDINIYPVKIELNEEEKILKKKWDVLPETLPHDNFILLMMAPPRSGKSVLIMNLLFNEIFNYKKLYDKIIFISPTLLNDKTLKYVVEDDDIIKIHEYDDISNIDGIIKGIIDDQKENKQHTLIILDDMVGQLGNNNKELNTLATRYRHFNISMIITSQNYKSFGVLLRNCASHWIFFKTNMLKEQGKIFEDMNSYPNFKELYNKATNERYSFIYIDQNNLKVYKKFNELLYSPEMSYKDNLNDNNDNSSK